MTKKICLVMIVKNESAIIERALDSLRHVVDMASIVDTGSTDNTADLVRAWGEREGIPTIVHSEPFVNFGYNRTHSAKAAQKAFPEADFLLLSDADFQWQGELKHRNLLLSDCYLVQQHDGNLSYWNIRLLNAKKPWQCKGVTHEYWAPDEGAGQVRYDRIHKLEIDDLGDGGCKADKSERDERLLRAGLEDPELEAGLRERYAFYLAQTLRDRGRKQEAIAWYEKRLAHGGFAEELYYSKYQIGKLQISLWQDTKDPTMLERAKQTLLDASQSRPHRAEALYALVRLYRELGENKEALKYALIGSKLDFPSQDTLFVEPACYDYLFPYELSIVAYYEHQEELGALMLEKLLARDDLPEHIRECCVANAKFYV